MKYKRIIFVSLLLLPISLICLFTFAQEIGYIQIKCEPGSTVFLDNKLVGTTSSELGGLILQDVPAGSHEVKIVKEGFKPQSVKIDLKENEIYLYEVYLKQKMGALLVETIPIDCIIEIHKLNIDKEHDGNKTEMTWEVSDIPIGSYRINFFALGKKVKYDLEIEEGTKKHLLVNILKNEVKELLPILTWNKTYGGSGNHDASSLIQTTDDGYAVAGSSTPKDSLNFDVWLIKLDNKGNKVWDRTYGGSGWDWARSLIQTTDDGYAVAGIFTSNGAGGWGFWVIKLDMQGNKVWDRIYGGNGNDLAFSLIQTTDGGYTIAGYVVTGYISSKDAGNRDFWVIKLDEQGNMVWDRIYGGNGNDLARSLIQTTDGGYAIAGSTSSKGVGGNDFWIIKLDEQGKIVWDRTYGENGLDDAYSLIQTTDGGYAIAGNSAPEGSVNYDVWLIKLDNKGNKIWDRTYGGSDLDCAYSLIQTTNGGYAIAGSTSSEGTGKRDAWVIKLDEQGNLIPGVSNLDYGAQTETETNYFLEGNLHCSDTRGYPCNSCGPPPDYINHFKGFNVLTTNEDCYVKLTYNDGDYIGNQNNCETTIKGEKWLGLEDKLGTTGLVKEIHKEEFDFKPYNQFGARTMNLPQDGYQYEFANEGREFRLYLSRDRVESFKAVPWQNIIIEIKNKETNKVFKYTFENGIFPQAYAWSGGVANYGQCVWWAAKRWVEEVDSKTLFPFYPPSPEAVNVKTIDFNYQPKEYDVLINYKPGGPPEHYGFIEKVEGDKVYITQFNFIKPGEVYNHVPPRTWNKNATNLFYSGTFDNRYYFKYYYRK